MSLQQKIEHHFSAGAAASSDPDAMTAFLELRDALEAGALRSAEPDPASPTGWRVNAWVKQGILLGFRIGQLVGINWDGVGASRSIAQANASPHHSIPESHISGGFPFVDKATFPHRHFSPEHGIRIVAGGTAIRAGAYVARSVIVIPPSYINTGSYVDEGALVDSHALVGSCAQIGKRVHLSAAAQVGGVLEPINASPVILEDDVLVGGNCGIYEGTIVRRKAVLAAGTILTRGTPVYDVVRGEILRAAADQPLIIPENAVVVPGARAVKKGQAAKPGSPAGPATGVDDWGLSVYTPVIVKYRDEKTELSAALEDILR
jgi:2,3,4,5-tetrahydropyridine-2,6-dicarboxylate N-succinyltransferase